MPGFDRTGPWGRGPMTGWGQGYCAGRGDRAFFGGGRGFGGSWGRGWRNRFNATGMPGWAWPGYGRGYYPGWRPGDAPAYTPEEEMDMLNAEAKELERDLEDIRQRMNELKKKQTDVESPND